MTAEPVTTGSRPRRMRRLIWPTLVAIVSLAILLSLGTWQVYRLNWKLALIERVETRVDDAAIAAPAPATWDTLTDETWDYRPVRVSGRFLDGELYYYIALSAPRGPIGGPGYFVYAPFETDKGFVVMINRGFVPHGREQGDARPGSEAPVGHVTLEGLWRRDERGNALTLEADEEAGIWFVRETPKMAAALGVSGLPVAPYSIDLAPRFTPAGGLPQAGETIITFRNNHLQYAVTWYGLAAALVVIFGVFVRAELRGEKGGTDR